MQYDFNLAPSTGMSIDVAGKFFKYKSGNGPIRVRTSKGGVVDLLPGQGVWNTDFTSLTITDRSGLQNAGVILAGAFDFHDDRIAGTVDVVDGGKARTLAGVAFSGVAACQPVAAYYSCVQLWNPAPSLKNVFVSKMFVTSSVAGTITLGTNTAANSASLGGCVSKKAGGALATARACPSEIPGASPVGFLTIGQVILQQNIPFLYDFDEPVMLPPGFGLCAVHGTLGTPVLSATFEFIEEAI